MTWMIIKLLGIACLLVVYVESAITASSCSWSNEGCSADDDCCSHSCFQAHEGTNSRCRHSSLGEKCIFDYHCQDDLICGRHYNCCSPYWKICNTRADCCDEQHVCRYAEAYYYKRCLYPSSAARLAPRINGPSSKLFILVAFIMGGRSLLLSAFQQIGLG